MFDLALKAIIERHINTHTSSSPSDSAVAESVGTVVDTSLYGLGNDKEAIVTHGLAVQGMLKICDSSCCDMLAASASAVAGGAAVDWHTWLVSLFPVG